MSSPQQTNPVKRAKKPNRSKEEIAAEKALKEARKEMKAAKKAAKEENERQTRFGKNTSVFARKYQKIAGRPRHYIVATSRAMACFAEKENERKEYLERKKNLIAERASQYAATKKFRTGAVVVAVDNTCCSTFQRVGKAIAIVDRPVPEHWMTSPRVSESMTVFKLNYNGQMFIIPTKDLRPATTDEKRDDPRNETYWKNVGKNMNLSRVLHHEKAGQYW
jgi:hypothetical protein